MKSVPGAENACSTRIRHKEDPFPKFSIGLFSSLVFGSLVVVPLLQAQKEVTLSHYGTAVKSQLAGKLANHQSKSRAFWVEPSNSLSLA